jgi:DNA-directed RNA polymerase beta subunit
MPYSRTTSRSTATKADTKVKAGKGTDKTSVSKTTTSAKKTTKQPRKNLKVKVSLDSSGEPNLDMIKESIEEQIKENNLDNNLEELFDFQTDSFKVCDSYFNLDNGKQLIAHHFKSFEQFIEKYLADVFEQFNPIEIYQEYDNETNNYKFELFISFEDYYIKPPTITEPDGETIEMTPNIARLRNLTYSSQLYVNVHMKRIIRNPNPNNPMPNLDNEDIKEMILPDIKFGKLPIMVQSKYCYLSKYEHCMIKQLGECENDLGGYFIVKGNEKVIVGQERIAGNKILVFNQQKQNKVS